MRNLIVVLFGISLFACTVSTDPDTRDSATDRVWLSVIGTNDVHGELTGDNRGLELFSGYVQALREHRSSDGVVLLLDGGDMWQGTLESNLNEGAAVVAAYNALGYDAATIGNHEFDFGPVGEEAIPVMASDDPRGALKARAQEAAFPLLAANIIEKATDAPVGWDNVQPSILIERAGVRVGLIGITTADTLAATIAPNTVGLSIAPLALTVETQARRLREQGADIVIVLAHAGAYCRTLGDPSDLSNCERDSEIFEVANALPSGLVDQIVAGHQHGTLANIVNDIAITSNGSGVPSFGRVDYLFDKTTRRVTKRIVFAPQTVCANVLIEKPGCASADAPLAEPATYESIAVQPMAEVVAVAAQATATATRLKNEPLGIEITEPITLANEPFAALGRLMTDAMREATNSDVSIHNVSGGIRSDIPAGPLTYGDVYRAFPFDNRISLLTLSVSELKTLFAGQVYTGERRVGVSGLRITVSCDDGVMDMNLQYSNGQPVASDAKLKVVANDYLLLGGGNIFTPITPANGFVIDPTQPRVRDVWANWFRERGGQIGEHEYAGSNQQRWYLPDPLPADCIWTP